MLSGITIQSSTTLAQQGVRAKRLAVFLCNNPSLVVISVLCQGTSEEAIAVSSIAGG